MIQEQIPSTQNTLYSRFGNAPNFGNNFYFYTLAKSLGYPYFEWNERVYKINYYVEPNDLNESIWEETGITYQSMIEAGV